MTDPLATSNPIHPKVKAGIITSGAITIVVAALAAITPDLLTFAGPWSVVLYAAIVAAGGFLAGYAKSA